jgi:predicted nucleic acid-binding protein
LAIKIIVDTNIIFSSILNTNGTIGDMIFNSEGKFDFYSCNYMHYEIEKHHEKLKRISKLTDQQLNIVYSKLLSRINFINEELIAEKKWLAARKLVQDIDVDDIDFVALALHLKGFLWTGDKVLYKGLKQKKFTRVYSTSELLTLRGL